MFKFIIDEEDIERCQNMNWSIFQSKPTSRNPDWKEYYYAQSSRNSKHPTVLLHRFITQCPKGFDVDHINKNTLDNRKENLRICTRSENLCNRKKQINNKSGHVGVSWNTKENKWGAYIMLHKKYINLGLYNDIQDAIKVRKEAEDKYFGEFKSKAG